MLGWFLRLEFPSGRKSIQSYKLLTPLTIPRLRYQNSTRIDEREARAECFHDEKKRQGTVAEVGEGPAM